MPPNHQQYGVVKYTLRNGTYHIIDAYGNTYLQNNYDYAYHSRDESADSIKNEEQAEYNLFATQSVNNMQLNAS